MNKLCLKIIDDFSYSVIYGLEYVVQQEVKVMVIGENVMLIKIVIEVFLGINVWLWFFSVVGRLIRNCYIQVLRLKFIN